MGEKVYSGRAVYAWASMRSFYKEYPFDLWPASREISHAQPGE